jgi:hypothetical protein
MAHKTTVLCCFALALFEVLLRYALVLAEYLEFGDLFDRQPLADVL